MTVYASDPRVTAVGDQWEVDGPDSDSGYPVSGAVIASGDGFKTWFDGAAGSPQMVWPTVDKAIRSMIGDPR